MIYCKSTTFCTFPYMHNNIDLNLKMLFFHELHLSFCIFDTYFTCSRSSNEKALLRSIYEHSNIRTLKVITASDTDGEVNNLHRFYESIASNRDRSCFTKYSTYLYLMSSIVKKTFHVLNVGNRF